MLMHSPDGLPPDDRRYCQDCARYRLGMCQSSVGFWANYRVPLELREMPLRCEGFREKKSDDLRQRVQRD